MKSRIAVALVTAVLVAIWLIYLVLRSPAGPADPTASLPPADPSVEDLTAHNLTPLSPTSFGLPELTHLGYTPSDLLALGVSWYHQGKLDAARGVFTYLSAARTSVGTEARAWAGSLLCKMAAEKWNPLDKVSLVEDGVTAMSREVQANPDHLVVHLVYLNTLLALPEFFGYHEKILVELAWLVESPVQPAASLEPTKLSDIVRSARNLKDWPTDYQGRLETLVEELNNLAATRMPSP